MGHSKVQDIELHAQPLPALVQGNLSSPATPCESLQSSPPPPFPTPLPHIHQWRLPSSLCSEFLTPLTGTLLLLNGATSREGHVSTHAV